MGDKTIDKKTLDGERLKKVLHYISAQVEINELTRGHLENVLENTQKASNSMFVQLSVVNSSMTELTDKLLAMYKRYEEVANQSAGILSEREKLIQHIEKHAEKLGSRKGKEKVKGKGKEKGEEEDNSGILELINEMRGHLQRLDAVYKQLNDFNDHLLDRVVEGINEFTNGIIESLVHLQFEDITRQQIETIFKYIGDNSGYLKCLMHCLSNGDDHCALECEVPLFNIDDIRKYYVMKSQRDVHQKVVETSASRND
jgi:hypothetical protein